MAELGIFSEEKQKWIQFDEDTEVLVRFINKELMVKLRKKAEKASRLSGSDLSDITNRNLGEQAVLGWRNITDHNDPGLRVNKQPLPFTPDNRDMLMKKSLEFSNFVNETAISSRVFLEDEENIGDGEAIKNG